ncbi:hypothetical protein RsoM2USA_167 [Ralstonia phage RsoM2USA]|nr:hypothetical protein RsoM2USA_167 [Ralstonia phage RsoM2USA]
MQQIKYHGSVHTIPTGILNSANRIKHLSYNISEPADFWRDTPEDNDMEALVNDMRFLVKLPEITRINCVFFSCASGAAEHVDKLDPNEFYSVTFIVPIILPAEGNILHVNGESMEVKIGGIYEFNHEVPHSMTVGDTTGAVVIMIAINKYD